MQIGNAIGTGNLVSEKYQPDLSHAGRSMDVAIDDFCARRWKKKWPRTKIYEHGLFMVRPSRRLFQCVFKRGKHKVWDLGDYSDACHLFEDQGFKTPRSEFESMAKRNDEPERYQPDIRIIHMEFAIRDFIRKRWNTLPPHSISSITRGGVFAKRDNSVMFRCYRDGRGHWRIERINHKYWYGTIRVGEINFFDEYGESPKFKI